VAAGRAETPTTFEEFTMTEQRIFGDVTETVGNTPLIQLNRLGAGLGARVVIKHEGFNPFNSVKDRIGAAMIEDAMERGDLKPGDRVLLSAFGAGLSWGSTVLTWPDIPVDSVR